MKKMGKLRFDRFFFLGVFVLASLVANQWVNFVRWQDPLEILWFCDLTALLLSVGLFTRNKTLISMTLAMAVPAQAIWILDFFLELFGVGMGRTSHLWSYGDLVFWLSVNLHAIIIPISFYGVWKLGFDKKAIGPIVVYVIFLLGSSFLFTPVSENRNCVFYGCDQEDPGGGYWNYFMIESLFYWIILMTISFYIMKFLFGKRKNKLKNS